MVLEWPDDVSTAVAALQSENQDEDYILYAVSDPKKPTPKMILHSKGKGGREKMAEILSSSECDDKVITGAFMASAVDERGDIVSIRRKFVHVTFVGGSVGALVKGKVNSWSGSFRDPFPNMSVYLQLNADRMDELDEKTLEASLIASSGGDKPSRIDFTNGERKESVKERWGRFQRTGKQQKQEADTGPEPLPEPDEPESFHDRVKAFHENSSPDAFTKKHYDNPNKVASDELAQCHEARERWGKTPELKETTKTTTKPTDMPMLEKDMLKDRMSAFGGGKERKEKAVSVPQKEAKGTVDSTLPPCKQPQDPSIILPGMWPDDVSSAVKELQDDHTNVDYILYAVSDPKKPSPEMILHSKGKGGREKMAEILSSSECDDKVITGAFMASAVDERGDIVSIRRKFVHVTFVGGSVGALVKGKVNSWSGNFRDPFPNMSVYLQLNADRMDELDEKTLEASLIASSGGNKPSRIDFTNGDRNERNAERVSTYEKVSSTEFTSSNKDPPMSPGPSLKDRVSAFKDASVSSSSKTKLVDLKEEKKGSPGASIKDRIAALDLSHKSEEGLAEMLPLPLTIDETTESKPVKSEVPGPSLKDRVSAFKDASVSSSSKTKLVDLKEEIMGSPGASIKDRIAALDSSHKSEEGLAEMLPLPLTIDETTESKPVKSEVPGPSLKDRVSAFKDASVSSSSKTKLVDLKEEIMGSPGVSIKDRIAALDSSHKSEEGLAEILPLPLTIDEMTESKPVKDEVVYTVAPNDATKQQQKVEAEIMGDLAKEVEWKDDKAGHGESTITTPFTAVLKSSIIETLISSGDRQSMDLRKLRSSVLTVEDKSSKKLFKEVVKQLQREKRVSITSDGAIKLTNEGQSKLAGKEADKVSSDDLSLIHAASRDDKARQKPRRATVDSGCSASSLEKPKKEPSTSGLMSTKTKLFGSFRRSKSKGT